MTVKTKSIIGRAITTEEINKAIEFMVTHGRPVPATVSYETTLPEYVIHEWPTLELANEWLAYTATAYPDFVTTILE